MNLAEAEARQRKATDFALVVREHKGTAAEMAVASESTWEAIRQLLIARGRSPRPGYPSAETRALVVRILESLEDGDRRHPDPFEGL